MFTFPSTVNVVESYVTFMVRLFVWRLDGHFLAGEDDINGILMEGDFEAVSMVNTDAFEVWQGVNRSRLPR